jgi:hypothetical protein
VLREIINRKKLQQIASSRNDQGKICSRNQWEEHNSINYNPSDFCSEQPSEL